MSDEVGIEELARKLAAAGIKATHAVIHPSKCTPEILEKCVRAGLVLELRDDVRPGAMFIMDSKTAKETDGE